MESQGKIRKKSGNFTFQSQGKIRGSGKVRENQSSRVQSAEVNKDAEKIFFTVTQTAYNSSQIFFSVRFARRLFVLALSNLFRHLCFQGDCKRLKANISISREQISQGKRSILSWKVVEKSGKMNSAK